MVSGLQHGGVVRLWPVISITLEFSGCNQCTAACRSFPAVIVDQQHDGVLQRLWLGIRNTPGFPGLHWAVVSDQQHWSSPAVVSDQQHAPEVPGTQYITSKLDPSTVLTCARTDSGGAKCTSHPRGREESDGRAPSKSKLPFRRTN